jgi:hypothetical protein
LDSAFLQIYRAARDNAKKRVKEERELERNRHSKTNDSDGTDYDSSHEPGRVQKRRTCYDMVAERLTGSETNTDLLETLAFKLPSFRSFFDRVATREDHENIFNQNWIEIRKKVFQVQNSNQ